MTQRPQTVEVSMEKLASTASCNTNRCGQNGSVKVRTAHKDYKTPACKKTQNVAMFRERRNSSPTRIHLLRSHAWSPFPERPKINYNDTNKKLSDSSSSMNRRRHAVAAATNRSVIRRVNGTSEVSRTRLRITTEERVKQVVHGRITQKLSTETFLQPVISNDEKDQSEGLTKFRHAVRLMRVLSAFCLSIRRYAEQEDSRMYDLYYYRDTLPTTKGRPIPVQDNSTYFDKSVFARQSTLHFPQWARWICVKRPEERSDAEINKLAALLRGLKSFGRFSRQAQNNLCRTISYACYEKRRIIVRQGHPGFCFYFIISGSVSVTVTRKDLKTGICVTNTVDVLFKNDSFGEIALISKDARRTATIMCRERVEVLLVDRETIFKYCPNVFRREHQDKVQVLRVHDLFQNWKREDLAAIAHEAQIKEYSYGKLIDSNTTTSEAVYFVIKGKAEILRRLDFSTSRPCLGAQSAPTTSKKSRVAYVNIGALAKGQAWDLNCLCLEAWEEERTPLTVISLVSSGVRLLKVTKKRILDLCPRAQLEQFSRSFIPGPFHRLSTDDQLCRDYATQRQWIDYREKVVQNVMDMKKHHPIAHISRTAKGFSNQAWTQTKNDNTL